MNHQVTQPEPALTAPDSRVSGPQPTLWQQLSPTQRRQLAQQLARLIRHHRHQPGHRQEGGDD